MFTRAKARSLHVSGHRLGHEVPRQRWNAAPSFLEPPSSARSGRSGLKSLVSSLQVSSLRAMSRRLIPPPLCLCLGNSHPNEFMIASHHLVLNRPRLPIIFSREHHSCVTATTATCNTPSHLPCPLRLKAAIMRSSRPRPDRGQHPLHLQIPVNIAALATILSLTCPKLLCHTHQQIVRRRFP